MLMAVTWSELRRRCWRLLNVWPRIEFAGVLCLLSLVCERGGGFFKLSVGRDAAGGGFLALFFAPRGCMPGWGAQHPPSRASLWLLQWEWFRIYFESGMVKLLSGDPQWRNFTAMDEYYQNGPLPTWIGWYVEHLPHWFHAASAVATLVMELGVVLMLFFPRRVRLICFFIVTPWEIGVILTANYAFLNYLVLALGFLLLDDVYCEACGSGPATCGGASMRLQAQLLRRAASLASFAHRSACDKCCDFGIAFLVWIGYVTTAEMVESCGARVGSDGAGGWLEPFRIANQYGLFAVMTRGRYEIEFQGSNDGQNWTPYLFRNKPQLLNEAPGIYAPYQPRFDWNLWFASLGDWQQNDIVPMTEERLLTNDARCAGAVSRAIPLGIRRHGLCARCCSSTGLQRSRKSAARATGGAQPSRRVCAGD